MSKNCCECETTEDLILIVKNGEPTRKFICEVCVKNSDDYGLCWCCRTEAAYPMRELNKAGECSDHDGESDMDEEDKEGWEDNIQRWNEE